MSLTLQIDPELFRRLEERARCLGVDVQDLAVAALSDLVAQNDDFERAMTHVIQKNEELYRRLG